MTVIYRETNMKRLGIINARQPETTMTILDSKSVKNAFTAEEKGYDAGKKNIGNKDTPWN